MNYKSVIEVKTKYADIFFDSIKPEIEDKKRERSIIDLKKSKQGLIISIESKDLNALRASMNNISRLLIVCEKSAKI